MSDFNFSTTASATPHHNATPEPLWSFHGVKSFPGPAGTVVLYKRDGDRRMMVQPDVAQALTLCSPFRSLAAHTQTVIAALPALAEHKDHTEQILAQVAEAGLFERSEAAWHRLTQETATEPSESVRIFILTCDRPSALERHTETRESTHTNKSLMTASFTGPLIAPGTFAAFSSSEELGGMGDGICNTTAATAAAAAASSSSSSAIRRVRMPDQRLGLAHPSTVPSL